MVGPTDTGHGEDPDQQAKGNQLDDEENAGPRIRRGRLRIFEPCGRCFC
jgi:hypothetical protein